MHVQLNKVTIKEEVIDKVKMIHNHHRPDEVTVLNVVGRVFNWGHDVTMLLKRPLVNVAVSDMRGFNPELARASIDSLTDDLIKNKAIILIDDYMKTGETTYKVREMLLNRGAMSVQASVLLLLRRPRKYRVDPLYCGYTVDNLTFAGYGIDYHGEFINAGYIGVPPETLKDGRAPRAPMKWMTDGPDRW